MSPKANEQGKVVACIPLFLEVSQTHHFFTKLSSICSIAMHNA
jgi:hypothetical protein